MFDLGKVRELIRRQFRLLADMSRGHVSVPVTRSTKVHLLALAAANGISLEELLSTWVEGLADAAGRRTGSWEAIPGSLFMESHNLLRGVPLDSVCVSFANGYAHGFVRFTKAFGASGVNRRRYRTARSDAI